jgi:hypothetical protein
MSTRSMGYNSAACFFSAKNGFLTLFFVRDLPLPAKCLSQPLTDALLQV